MQLILTVIAGLFLVLILIALIGAWIYAGHERMTDEQLYGMSAYAYSLKNMGDEEFKKHFSEEEYAEARKELDEVEEFDKCF